MKNIIKVLLASLIGLTLACTTAPEPTPTNEISVATVNKITAYGTSKGVTFTRTPDDIFHATTLANPTGRVPQANEYVKLHYVYTDLQGKILDSTAIVRNIPATFLLYPSSNANRPLLNYAAALMKEGEKSIVIFPSTANSPEPTVLTATMISTRNETEQIDGYIKEKFPNLPVKKTATGLQYLITKTSASGDTVKTGKNASVTYTGRFLYQYKSTDSNGFPAYTDRFDGGSFSFIVGQAGAIAGFQEAAKLMKVGDKGVFVFPSSLGYGTAGSGSIAGYTPLLFEMEVTAVK